MGCMLPVLAACLATSLLQPQTPPQLVPQPVAYEAGKGHFAINDRVSIAYLDREGNSSAEPQARLLAEELWLLTGKLLDVKRVDEGAGSSGAMIVLAQTSSNTTIDPGTELHGYELHVTSNGVRLHAQSPAGLAHGIATILQMVRKGPAGHVLPAATIKDQPAYAFRTLLIDVARNPHSTAVLEDVVRLMHLYKLRYLHLHLTDNQLFTFPFPAVTDHLENNKVYARAELEALVRYAAIRGVTIIPEIDLPGHSSRLRQSGYLPGAKNDGDVASEEHWGRIATLLNAVMDVFDSSPYFHIGGDESGAGAALLPFLARVQKLVRSRGKRLIVWEGFHGRPTNVLPATGPDRVIVAAWESSYNPPWNLLDAGYEIINASWKPLYVVGSHNVVHPGSTGGRKWTPRELAQWEPAAFWHWEPGRPVFEDRGPKDPDRTDQTWNARWVGRERQIIGSQMSVWEQRETSVTHDLRFRIPVFAERVWRGADTDPEDLLRRTNAVDERVFGIVQPVAAVVPKSNSPLAALFEQLPPDGLRLRNRLGLNGTIRYALAPFTGSPTWLSWADPKDPIKNGISYGGPIQQRGGFAVRAQLQQANGKAVPGTTWMRVQDWPARVRIQEFEIGARTPKVFPDLGKRAVRNAYSLPMLRGPIRHNRVTGQRFSATLRAPATGEFTVSLKTQSGRARLWLDMDGNEQFDDDEEIIKETPSTEEPQTAKVTLDKDRAYALRIDHISGLPRPVVIATLAGPTIDRQKDVSEFLVPLH